MGRPKQAIIEAIGRFHYLSARQLTSLLFSKGSLTYVRAHCCALYQAGYLQRIYLPRRQPGGSSLAIYILDKRGYAWLAKQGRALAGRFRSAEETHREELFLAHSLAVNDLLILAYRLSRQHPEIRLARMLTERALKQKPVYVTVSGTKTSVIPDGWVDLRIGGTHQMCLALELDRGTMERERFQRRIRAYLAYARGPYQHAFGTQSLTVLFVTTTGVKRLEEMLQWTQRQLTKLNAADNADLFRFASVDPAEAEPDAFFFAPIWRKPDEDPPLPLLGRQEGPP